MSNILKSTRSCLSIVGPVLIGLGATVGFGGYEKAGWGMFSMGCISLVLIIPLQHYIWRSQRSKGEPVSAAVASGGGKGGNAKVIGSGIAIGGTGGHGGKYGIGGAGGSAVVYGSGLAAGGAGGSAGGDGIWRAPAKSGYEIAQRALGLPIDPLLRQAGRGGAMPGYEPKLRIIEEIRAAYFEKRSQRPQNIFENISAVPLDYLNSELFKRGENWRVRVIEDEYEFFIPPQ